MTLLAKKVPLDIEEFKMAMPASMRKSVDKEMFNRINEKLQDPRMYEDYRENLIGFSNVLKQGKFKIDSYVNAIKYISHKLQGRSNREAHALTFPEKHADWLSRAMSAETQDTYISAFNRSKLVSMMLEQTLTPFWITNQDVYQKAINTQAQLMATANSEKVRSDAANSLLTHLKPPEAQKVDLSIGSKDDSAIGALRDTIVQLAEQQRAIIQNNVHSVRDITEATIEHRVE